MKTIIVLNSDETLPGLRMTRMVEQVLPEPFLVDGGMARGFDMGYVTEGCLWLRHAAGPVRVGAGEIYFRGPHQSCEIFSDGPVTVFHCHFNLEGMRVEFLGAHLREWAHGVYYAANPQPYAQSLFLPDTLHLQQRARAEELLLQVLREQATGGPGSLFAVQGNFLRFLHLITQEVLTELTRGTSAENQTRHQHIRRAVEYIEANIANPLIPRQVAAHVELNHDYLGRLFVQFLGESIGAYLMHRRLAVARHLLTSSTLSIKQVARQVGFADPLYFSRLFHREEGCSPRTYQRIHGQSLLPLVKM